MTNDPSDLIERLNYCRDKFQDNLAGRAADRIAQLQADNERLRKALWLFREFTIRNATQWQLGAGHHHPIWAMVAELVGEMGGIASGQYYEFIQPDNRAALQETKP